MYQKKCFITYKASTKRNGKVKQRENKLTNGTYLERVNEGTGSVTETALSVLAETTSSLRWKVFHLSGFWWPKSKLFKNPCLKSTLRLGFWVISEVEHGDDTAAAIVGFREKAADTVLY